ncbi:MAG: septal ring lytic transglycosylase RlpA family protein [Hyphomicrobiaceae bacterium]|nr:MAG: septal ring lytic transglycosylase RlpA family protein [Hyphomicrobiaceae bacterium]
MGIRNAIAVLAAGIGAWLLAIAPAAADVGIASHYSELSVTASGRSYSPSAMVAAHRSLPFGTKVLVENLSNGRSQIVTIVDRGPFIRGRIIDLSIGAARNLGFADKGLQNVRISVLGRDDTGTRIASNTKRRETQMAKVEENSKPDRRTRMAKVEEDSKPARRTRMAKVEEDSKPARRTRIAANSDDDEAPVRRARTQTRERSSDERVRLASREAVDFESTHFRERSLYLR